MPAAMEVDRRVTRSTRSQPVANAARRKRQPKKSTKRPAPPQHEDDGALDQAADRAAKQPTPAVPSSLQELDPKHRVDLLQDNTPSPLPEPDAYKVKGTPGVWVIDNFLTPGECDHIAATTKRSALATEVGAGHTRLLAFDPTLLELLEGRLVERDCFWQRLVARDWTAPPTFHDLEFEPPEIPRCNPCLRVHQFTEESPGFHVHRDAPYVQSEAVRSNYTLLVYLSDEGTGATEFRPTVGPYDGRRLAEEKQVGSASVQCAKGRAVVFDQRIPHAGVVGAGVKVVLRTDILAVATANPTAAPLTPAQSKAIEWFRRAQHLELRGDTAAADEWYERVLNLRAGGAACLAIDPALGSDAPMDVADGVAHEEDPGHSQTLTFIARTPKYYEFGYSEQDDEQIPRLVRAAALFTATTECTRYDGCAWKIHMASAMAATGVHLRLPAGRDGAVSRPPRLADVGAATLWALLRRLDRHEPDIADLVRSLAVGAPKTAEMIELEFGGEYAHVEPGVSIGDSELRGERGQVSDFDRTLAIDLSNRYGIQGEPIAHGLDPDQSLRRFLYVGQHWSDDEEEDEHPRSKSKKSKSKGELPRHQFISARMRRQLEIPPTPPPIATRIRVRKHSYLQIRCVCPLSDADTRIPKPVAALRHVGATAAIEPAVVELMPESRTRGLIHLSGRATAFNHASCNCETVFVSTDEPENVETFAACRSMEYTCDLRKRRITIHYTPLVVL